MIELIVIGSAIATAARWLRKDTERRDHDPRSQTRSDWLEFREWDRKQPPPLPRNRKE